MGVYLEKHIKIGINHYKNRGMKQKKDIKYVQTP
jgi:hypothetical protein